jgi:hypothetical protein
MRSYRTQPVDLRCTTFDARRAFAALPPRTISADIATFASIRAAIFYATRRARHITRAAAIRSCLHAAPDARCLMPPLGLAAITRLIERAHADAPPRRRHAPRRQTPPLRHYFTPRQCRQMLIWRHCQPCAAPLLRRDAAPPAASQRERSLPHATPPIAAARAAPDA